MAKPITPVAALRASGPSVDDEDDALAPEPPCSGRCGHCHHHPCRLHGGI